MVPLHLEKQKQDEKQDQQQKQFFHEPDIITCEFLKEKRAI